MRLICALICSRLRLRMAGIIFEVMAGGAMPLAAQQQERFCMIRTFAHSFDPASANPIKGPVAELTTDEIEDAGIREVLQTPGATLGSWAILDALLVPTGPGSPFVFREPLGQAREVKVALSGLFGRFVARAYLERYFGLSNFAHLGQRGFLLKCKLLV